MEGTHPASDPVSQCPGLLRRGEGSLFQEFSSTEGALRPTAPPTRHPETAETVPPRPQPSQLSFQRICTPNTALA